MNLDGKESWAGSDTPPPDSEYQGREARAKQKVSIIDEKNLGVVDEELKYDDVSELAAIASSLCWAPGIFNESKRLIKNLRSISLLVLDVDDGATLSEAKERFKDYKHIIATSRSHQKEKNGVVCDRFRVVLFLDSEITNDQDFKATWNTAFKRWPFIDKACKDSSRFFYPSPEIVSINSDGRVYPVSIMVQQTEPAREMVLNQRELGTVQKGELWKSTLDLLLNGAPAGTRHTRLVSAVRNMKEQGYDLPEIVHKLQEMTERADWTQPELSVIDLKTIHVNYDQKTKYPLVPKESDSKSPAIIVNAAELLDETFAYLNDKEKVKGEATGIEGLDTLLGGGFRTGELTVLMAQAKTGKNTLYHYLIYKHLERHIPFGYASRELNPATEVIPNLLSIALKENAWTANVGPEYQLKARECLKQWPLYFAPGYGYFPAGEIETWFRALKDLGVNHFLFDHFHYSLQGEDYEATATLIKKLKSLTKELDIHLSLIVQPRSLRDGEPLSLATLRGGAAIGQALDNLLILERVKGESNISKLTLEVARHKLAKLGHVFLQYDSTTTNFVEVDKRVIIDEQAPPMPRGFSREGKFNRYIQS